MNTVTEGITAAHTRMVEQPIVRASFGDALRFLLASASRQRMRTILRSRRSLVLTAILLSVATAVACVWDPPGRNGRAIDKALGLLFVINFSWISALFWNNAAGFLNLWFGS